MTLLRVKYTLIFVSVYLKEQYLFLGLLAVAFIVALSIGDSLMFRTMALLVAFLGVALVIRNFDKRLNHDNITWIISRFKIPNRMFRVSCKTLLSFLWP